MMTIKLLVGSEVTHTQKAFALDPINQLCAVQEHAARY